MFNCCVYNSAYVYQMPTFHRDFIKIKNKNNFCYHSNLFSIDFKLTPSPYLGIFWEYFIYEATNSSPIKKGPGLMKKFNVQLFFQVCKWTLAVYFDVIIVFDNILCFNTEPFPTNITSCTSYNVRVEQFMIAFL